MLENDTINLKVIEKVALALGDLNEEVVYVGGAVISLYVNDLGAEQPRPTKDIDISVQIGSYAQMELLRERLAKKNIFPAPQEKVIYRYIYQDILIDFIPYESTSLGPTNQWLKPGFEHAYKVDIGVSSIRILPVSLFIATKWAAFKDRGSDPRTSPDFEDIIYVIDNNLDFVDNVLRSGIDVQNFLKEMSIEILSHPSLHEIIECHMNPLTALERGKLLIAKLKSISQ